MAAEHAYRSDQSSGSSIQQAEAAGLAVQGKRMRAGVRVLGLMPGSIMEVEVPVVQRHVSCSVSTPLASARANAAGM